MVKTLFYGTPAFALPTLQRLIDSPHPVVAVITQPDRPRGRGRRVSASPVKQLATAHDIPVLEPTRARSETLQRTVSSFGADLAVVAAYGKILPDALLDTPRLGTINVHASLLPHYRGAAPIQRAILAGDATTGVTIIRLVAEMDAGPMLARGSVPIGPTETSIVVERALSRLGADLLLETVGALERGDAAETEQDHAAATYAPRLTKDDGVIDWTRPACAIHDQIRGLHPWPHASSVLAGQRFLIHQSRPLDRATSQGARQGRPGELIDATGDQLVVATGEDTSLAIVEIQPEGRRPVAARAFLAGHRWTAGLRFDAAPR